VDQNGDLCLKPVSAAMSPLSELPPDRWTEILSHHVKTGKLVPIVEWLFVRIDQPEIRAKIDALPASHSGKVVAAIGRIVREWNADGVVSEEAVFEFSKNGWWLPEVFPLLPPDLRKKVEKLIVKSAEASE
jgi:hypothetical protein